MSKIYIITALHNDRKVERKAHSDFQTWVIINTLAREGATDICMKEE